MASAFVAPKITNIDLAPDDAIWLVEADIDCLKALLTNPGAFVRAHVKTGGKPAVLCEPFVMTFQPMPVSDGSTKIFIQGISGTAMIKVRYSIPIESVDMRKRAFPEGEPHCILKHGSQVYGHIELHRMSKAEIAESIVKGIMSMDSYLDDLNDQPQVINGVPVAPGEKKLAFRNRGGDGTRFIFQGWSAPAEMAIGMKDDSGGDTPICEYSDGDSDENGNVWVNGVIVKTYTVPEPPPAEPKP